MAFSVGFISAFVSALALWIIDKGFWWLSLVALGAGVAISAPIFFFAHYRPTVVKSARRIDRYGLEERLITMVEYENDDSLMAKTQREDAVEKLSRFKAQSIRIAVSTFAVVFLIITAIVGSGMVTVSTLSAFGLLPDFSEVMEQVLPEEPEVYVSVTYEVEGGGFIEGEADQLVLLGGNAEPVEAIADEGYAFLNWDDGYKKTVRSDGGIREDIILIAIFEEVGDGEGEGDGDAEGDQEGQSGKPGGKPGENPSSNQENDDSSSNQGGGKYEEANQIIDGETYYREVLGGYVDDIIKYLEEHGDELTDEERKIIEAYIGIV
jgi:hypothetical protein